MYFQQPLPFMNGGRKFGRDVGRGAEGKRRDGREENEKVG